MRIDRPTDQLFPPMPPFPRPLCRHRIRERRLELVLALAFVFSGTPAVTWAKVPVGSDTKVVSHVYNGYARTALPDGTYQPETFIFADGGFFNGEPMAGDEINTLTFADVAKTVAIALKEQNYLPTTETDHANQLIMLWYGTLLETRKEKNPLVVNQKFRILGVHAERAAANALYFTSLAGDFHDEFDSNRYFVVLKAYDFQIAAKEKRLKLLWESRFSIRRQATNFIDSLPAMTAFAARTFGRETDGVYRPDRLESAVEIGDLKVLGTDNP